MVIFHGYVSHNQGVTFFKISPHKNNDKSPPNFASSCCKVWMCSSCPCDSCPWLCDAWPAWPWEWPCEVSPAGLKDYPEGVIQHSYGSHSPFMIKMIIHLFKMVLFQFATLNKQRVYQRLTPLAALASSDTTDGPSTDLSFLPTAMLGTAI